MQNLKVKVNNTNASEAIDLLVNLGHKLLSTKKGLMSEVEQGSTHIVNTGNGLFTTKHHYNYNVKETTLAELRSMVIKPMQEYLNTETYEYKLAHNMPDGEWLEIPDGAEIAIKFNVDDDEHGVIFYKNDGKASAPENNNFEWNYGSQWSNAELLDENFAEGGIDLSHKVLWVRPKQPEALPFIDDNPQSLNEQYAEIEQVRQTVKVKSGSDSDHAADAMSYGFMSNVNHPTHYTKGKVECIDAIESATVGKTGIDAVCVANVIKYLWRYEEKGGIESIKKAEWYLQKLIENNI